jgi:hypothetical protein
MRVNAASMLGAKVLRRAHDADAHDAAGDAAVRCERLLRFAQQVAHARGIACELLAGLRQVQLLPDLLEQRHACAVLELFHLDGNRRLREMQLARRLGEAQMLRDQGPDAELSQRDVSHRSRVTRHLLLTEALRGKHRGCLQDRDRVLRMPAP